MSSRLGDAPPRPGALRSLGSHIAGPHLQSIFFRISMQRLETGYHSQLAEARNIAGGYGFNVLDAVAGIRAVIGLLRFPVGIQGQANRAIADSMGEDLNTVAVEFCDRFLISRRIP